MVEQLRISEAFTLVDALTQEQRDYAYDSAKKRIVGDAPLEETFMQGAYQKYSPTLVKMINRMADAVMFAAFVPSAIRIFVAAFSTFAYGVPSYEGSVLVGFTSILLAEIGQVVFTLARATSETGKNVLAGGAFACTAYALIGNAQVAQPWQHGYVFAWLETFAPPILVLIAAHVRKTQFLNADAIRFSARQQYETAKAQWDALYRSATIDALWDRTLANALWDALRNANKSKKKVLRDLTSYDKRALIMRERSAEEWWDAVEAEVQYADAAHQRSANASAGERTYETNDAVVRRDDGQWQGECPYCHKVFIAETPKGATNALSAHIGRWCEVRNSHSDAVLMHSANGRKATTQV